MSNSLAKQTFLSSMITRMKLATDKFGFVSDVRFEKGVS